MYQKRVFGITSIFISCIFWGVLIHAILAVTYHSVSIYMGFKGKNRLSPMSPLIEILVIVAYSISILCSINMDYYLYGYLSIFWTLVFGGFFILLHAKNYFENKILDLYYSISAWFLIMGLNMFGSLVNIAGIGVGFHQNLFTWVCYVVIPALLANVGFLIFSFSFMKSKHY